MLEVAVDNDYGQALGYGDRGRRQIPAVNQERVVCLAACRDQLIHDTAVAAHPVLSTLPDQRNVLWPKPEFADTVERRAHADFESC